MHLGKVSRAVLACAIVAAIPSPAFAGETVLYQPSPAWVKVAALPAATGSDTAPIAIYDSQQKVEGGQLWRYNDTAVRIASAEMLAQFSTVAAQWSPDQGDLIIHEISIVRDGETIDLLKGGMKLDVLRREELLEQRQLTGVLSATAAIQGLRVGDLFRLRYSSTQHDKVLGDHVQAMAVLPVRPLRIGTGRLRVIWPVAENAKWQILTKDSPAAPVRHGDTMELEVPLPLAKQPEMPADVPARFRPLPLFEFSTFRDWPEVSRTFAPLYAAHGLIADGTPLAAEADKIAAASTDPLTRAQAALQLVQDKVRYLAVQMNGGNYTPQKPEETWQLRYGDCKAKTLLLLALLDRLGVEAEAVTASATGGAFDLPRRLPSAAVFDHVLVRAKVGGQSLWLDGTGLGSRIEDIHDTPDFGYVLPLRTAGAEPELIETHANARPTLELEADYDESTSLDLPAVVTAKVTLHGAQALGIGLAANSLDPEQRDDMVRSQLTRVLGQGQYPEVSIETSTDNATTVLKGRGIVTTVWRPRDRLMQRRMESMLADFSFIPDRARAEWRQLPVATTQPVSMVYHVRIKLPDAGKGYTLQGANDIDASVGGSRFTGHAALTGGLFSYDERQDASGQEVPADLIAADRAQLAKAQAQVPQIVAPANATRRWDLTPATKGTTQAAAIDGILTKAMAAKEPKPDPWIARASVRRGIGDYKGAREDLTHAIALSADAPSYLERAEVNRALGDVPGAMADARKAQELDPSDSASADLVATLLALEGKTDEVRELIDEKIALGGDELRFWQMSKVEKLGLYADATEALSMLDTLMTQRPQSPDLLNLACWIKGMRGVEVESAVRQCSSAVELAASPVGPLDSRAVIWFRLGRYDDALHDLDAVILEAPTQAESRYMRGIVLARLGRAAESRDEIAVARRLDPGVDTLYTKLGIKP
ncbi:tetratricopeptide repeat protein [Novosphingobium sp. PhB165]|uniref:tetratricopeptide repeat protein n=1 Tax=Novosphingobium sp. PhB165 TaxID=2485105 RepID=UPI00104A60A2|nr:tetratricopeptide repeat protein [Novosphingobium sp. PhB165]TCM22428.1 tetratricopeptide repeat protein [Novosphingobium sp. PhB165]